MLRNLISPTYELYWKSRRIARVWRGPTTYRPLHGGAVAATSLWGRRVASATTAIASTMPTCHHLRHETAHGLWWRVRWLFLNFNVTARCFQHRTRKTARSGDGLFFSNKNRRLTTATGTFHVDPILAKSHIPTSRLTKRSTGATDFMQ